VVLFYSETKAYIPHLLICDERFMTLNKNHLRTLDKMLLSSLKKMRCKYLIRATDLYRGGVSQLNDDGYNLEVVKDVTFIRVKVPTRSTKTIKKKLNSGRTLNFIQFHPCQTQSLALKFSVIFILVVGFWFVHL
jgi:hypothetical protein